MHSRIQLSLLTLFHGVEEGTIGWKLEEERVGDMLLVKSASGEANRVFLVILKKPWPTISTKHPSAESSTLSSSSTKCACAVRMLCVPFTPAVQSASRYSKENAFRLNFISR